MGLRDYGGITQKWDYRGITGLRVSPGLRKSGITGLLGLRDYGITWDYAKVGLRWDYPKFSKVKQALSCEVMSEIFVISCPVLHIWFCPRA